jgi:hypothetical protein
MHMAKAKAAAAKRSATPAKSAAESQRQKNVLALRGTERWKEWLTGFAASKGMPVTVFIDHALRELARREGYVDPPARVP